MELDKSQDEAYNVSSPLQDPAAITQKPMPNNGAALKPRANTIELQPVEIHHKHDDDDQGEMCLLC